MLVDYGLVQAHHFVAGEVRESARRPGRGDMPADPPFISRQDRLCGFACRFQNSSASCAKVFSARSAAGSASRWPTGFSPRAILALYSNALARASITLRSGNLPSVSRHMRPSFPHEALRAVAGYRKRETGNLVVAQEKLAALGWHSPVDQTLDEVCHCRRYVGS